MFPFTVLERKRGSDFGEKPVEVTAEMPGRRGYGTQGKKIVLRTNYLKVNTGYEGVDESIEEVTLFKYDVDAQIPTGGDSKSTVSQPACKTCSIDGRLHDLYFVTLWMCSDARFIGFVENLQQEMFKQLLTFCVRSAKRSRSRSSVKPRNAALSRSF